MHHLEQLQKRAHENGVTDCVLLSQADVNKLEPALKSCGGMLSPSTGTIPCPLLLFLPAVERCKAECSSMGRNASSTSIDSACLVV